MQKKLQQKIWLLCLLTKNTIAFSYLSVVYPLTTNNNTSVIYPIATTHISAPTTNYLNFFADLYRKKQFKKLVTSGLNYLQKYPHDGDVRLYVALSYEQLKNAKLASNHFQLILNEYKNYSEAHLGLIQVLIMQKKYQAALTYINEGLQLNPHANNLRLLKAQLFFLLKNNKLALAEVKKILKDEAKNKPAITLKRAIISSLTNQKNLRLKIKNKKKRLQTKYNRGRKKPAKPISKAMVPYFSLGGFINDAPAVNYVNGRREFWSYSSVYLYRVNKFGSFGGAVNSARRNWTSGSQLIVNPQPKLNNNSWLDLNYGYANNPILFPNTLWGGELYTKLTYSMVASIGDIYKKVLKTYFNTYTGSISQYINNYFISVRPFHFVPKKRSNNQPISTLIQVTARKYGDDPRKFFGVTVAGGTSPDLFDLETVNFFKLKDYYILVGGQLPLSKYFAIQYGTGFEYQKFPSGFIRRLYYINFGINLIFR